MKKVAIKILTTALGDTISGIPTLNKLSKSYEQPITVFTNLPILFENHPSVLEVKNLNDSTDGYIVHNTFEKYVKQGNETIEKKHNAIDIRQFHAWDLGINLAPDELECDLYCEEEIDGFEGENFVIIHPSKTWDSRTWDEVQWQSLVDGLINENINVISVGSSHHPKEWCTTRKKFIDKNLYNLKGVTDLINKTSIPQLRWLLKNKCLCVITMDSGILHLAGTTDCNIIQLGSSINYKFRAPWRRGSQKYKYQYIGGTCNIACASDIKYGLKEHDDIHGIPPLIDCREDYNEYLCHPTFKNVLNAVKSIKFDNNTININYNGRPKVEILGDYKNKYFVEFLINGEVIHDDLINNNMWTVCNVPSKDLVIRINGKIINKKPQQILIKCNSGSLGDTIASIPYAEKYRIDNNCDVSVKIPKVFKFLFVNSYPNLKFVDNEKGFDTIIPINYDFYTHLQEGFAQSLGYDSWKYIKPILKVKKKNRPIKEKYVVINVHSTAQLKYWNHPKGKGARSKALYWTELCDMLKQHNLIPVVTEKNSEFGNYPDINVLPKNCLSIVGKPLEEVVNYIQHAEFFIGLSSGLAWVAHGLNKKVAMIANFTDEEHEMPLNEINYKRIVNKSVCHGCFNNPKHKFKGSEWEWCPEHKNTTRQFECHTSITPKQVFNEIKEWI
tara:strand:+ start:1850 stop:3859 length:2010 start_codon:yes stop_codon:yes gene_type:complete